MINMDNLLLVKDMPGYSPHISRMLSMMNYARFTTLRAVEDLTVQQLDYHMDADGNTIGMLLEHFAAVEYYYQIYTFENRTFNEEEKAIWGAGMELGAVGREKIKGNELTYYLEKLVSVRERTYELFKSVNDEWLHEERDFWYGKQANHYFMWFHVYEDEINHRGQIRLIRKRLPKEE
ncbi:DinB family protein [Paenibacillus sp. N1-5-1-14]|uniref:DinB family protein n=1 Tax=Paenibacillus radicibacter TaxID=2972488 RepID=UPI0021597306|nr:DinB family protein [Paenibacillus radicibacter]MCR8644389.1 DinB family protein [Paenibacillus radicibacter]